MAQSSRPKQKSESRYPEPELADEFKSAEYWLVNYNRSVFKTLSDIHGNTETIKANMATKSDISAVKSDIAELTKLVREGFASLGVNISNGDGRIARPVR